jgi:hypothetical protein
MAVWLSTYVLVQTYCGLGALGGATLSSGVAGRQPRVLKRLGEKGNEREGKGTLFRSWEGSKLLLLRTGNLLNLST